MKQFLAVAALNEAVKKHCDTRRDVKIYTEGFKAVQHEAMEFSVMCDGELYQLEKLHEDCDRLVFLIPQYGGSRLVCLSALGRKSDGAYGGCLFLYYTER